jgi:subtilisin family serine protease
MRLNPIAFIVLCVLSSAPSALPARAAGLDLPVWTPGSRVQPPCYRGDVLEVRLTPAAARTVVPRGAGPTRALPVGRLGLPAIDALSASLGIVAFEPEFRGEAPPADEREPDFTAFHLLHLAPGSDLGQALNTLRGLAEVASADPIALLPVSAALPNDSLAFATYWLYKDQPMRTDIRAPEAWQVEQGDTNIVVGIIDTGVVPYHPDLGGRGGERGQMWINWAERAGLPGVDDDANGYIDDVGGWDFVDSTTTAPAGAGEDGRYQDNDPNDYGGHGTAVAGIIGAIPGNGIGLAGVVPNVRLMSLRIGWWTGGALPSGTVDMSYAAQAIRYATRMGVTVVNCSWQSINSGGLDAAVTAATHAGMIVVNASGNGGTSFTYLGQRDDVISVTATDSSDVVAVFAIGAVTGPWVDLAAAGVHMVSTMLSRLSQSDSLAGRTPSYQGFLNGTSFAAPQVTGAVALLQAQRRQQGLKPLSPAGMLARLRETTDDISAENPAFTGYGTGRLNLFRALTDPPRSLAIRAGARSIGPGVILRDNLGRTRVVYAMSDHSLIAFDGVTGDTVWVRPLPGLPTGNLAAAEFGAPYGALLFVGTTTGSVLGFDYDGRPVPGWPQTAQAGMNMSAGVVLADVTGDGVPEVIAGGTTINGSKLWAWTVAGSKLPGFPFDPGIPGMSPPAAADLDGVPGAEIALTDGLGALHVVGSGGGELTGFPAAAATSARAPVIARLGGPGTPPSILLASAGELTAYAPDGSQRWMKPLPGTPVQDPALADLDGDGVDEIVLALGAPNSIAVCDSSGAAFTARPGWPAALPVSVVGPPIVGPLTPQASATGPGVAFFGGGALNVLDENGQVVLAFPKPGGAGQSPSLDELDGDGATEIAAGSSPADSNIYTYDAGAGTWSTARAQWPTPRGDITRSASHAAGSPGPYILDRIRPAAVSDLEAHALTTTSASVRWTVTGDDSLTGTAARILLRRAQFRLDEQSFSFGIDVPTRPPGAANTSDTVTVTGLPEGSTWWFAMRVFDRVGNASAVSNSDSASLPGLPPAAISDLRVLSVAESTVVLAWTATGDDGNVGRPLGYRIAASPAPLDSAGFDAAPVQIRRPAFTDAGGGETLSVNGLTPGRRWRFAVRAVDRTQTLSAMSNVPEAITPVGGALAGRTGVALAPRPMPAVAAVTVDWQGDPGATGPQWLLVYDLNGRELRRIALGTEPGGSYNWDGRDGASRLLPAGLYFLRLVSGARHAESRVVFVR